MNKGYKASTDVWQMDKGPKDYILKPWHRRLPHLSQAARCLSISPPDVGLLSKNRQLTFTHKMYYLKLFYLIK